MEKKANEKLLGQMLVGVLKMRDHAEERRRLWPQVAYKISKLGCVWPQPNVQVGQNAH